MMVSTMSYNKYTTIFTLRSNIVGTHSVCVLGIDGSNDALL